MRNSILLTLALVSAVVFSFAVVAKSSGADTVHRDATGFALSTGIDDIVLEGPIEDRTCASEDCEAPE